MVIGKQLLLLLLYWPLMVSGAVSQDEDRLLTAAEIASLDRENAMWHLVRVEEDAATNFRLLRSRGFTESEVNSIRARLTAIWEVELERNYGWLSKEAIKRIEAVDRVFSIRLRAVRLFEEIGVRTGPHKLEKITALSRDWQRAIQRELDYRETTEFRLMNSNSAIQVARLVKGLVLNADELRTLCEWQREYDGVHGLPGKSVERHRSAWRKETLLDHWARIRPLLGDQRFAVYLSGASPGFARMNQVVGQLESISPSMTLDLWWLRQKHEIARIRASSDKGEIERLDGQLNANISSLLGETRLAAYYQIEDPAWTDP